MDPFFLTINGGPQLDLETLRMSFTGLHLQSLQLDTATLSYNRAGAGSPSPIAEGDVVEIWMSGRRLFVGRARLGGLGHGSLAITLRGPWSHLDDHYWQMNPVNGLPISGGPTDNFWTARGPMFGPITLTVGGVVVTIPSMTVRQQLEQILTYAFVNLTPPILPGTGTVAAGVRNIPQTRSVRRQVQDLKLSAALRQCLTSQPDAASWYDYAVTGLPVLNFSVAATETAETYPVGQYPLVDYNLDLLHELKVNGVSVAYESGPFPPLGTGARLLMDQWPTTGAAGTRKPGILLQTLPIDPTPVVGAAAALYEALGVLRSSGTIVIQDSSFNRGLRPGMTLNLTGDSVLDAEPVQHWVQSVRWNPANGQATCTVGYPGHLGLREIHDLARFLRRCLEGYRAA